MDPQLSLKRQGKLSVDFTHKHWNLSYHVCIQGPLSVFYYTPQNSCFLLALFAQYALLCVYTLLTSFLQWTLLTFAVGTSSETVDTGFPTVPTHTMGVRAGVSSSPFPSPGYTPMAHTPHSLVGSIGSSGAFIPYRKPTREEEGRRQQRNPLEVYIHVHVQHIRCTFIYMYMYIYTHA